MLRPDAEAWLGEPAACPRARAGRPVPRLAARPGVGVRRGRRGGQAALSRDDARAGAGGHTHVPRRARLIDDAADRRPAGAGRDLRPPRRPPHAAQPRLRRPAARRRRARRLAAALPGRRRPAASGPCSCASATTCRRAARDRRGGPAAAPRRPPRVRHVARGSARPVDRQVRGGLGVQRRRPDRAPLRTIVCARPGTPAPDVVAAQVERVGDAGRSWRRARRDEGIGMACSGAMHARGTARRSRAPCRRGSVAMRLLAARSRQRSPAPARWSLRRTSAPLAQSGERAVVRRDRHTRGRCRRPPGGRAGRTRNGADAAR